MWNLEWNAMGLLPVAVFGMSAALVWLILDFAARRDRRTEQRLDEIQDPTLRRRRDAQKKASAKLAFSDLLARATPALAKPLQPKNEHEASKLRMRLVQAGFRSEVAPTYFLGFKFSFLVVGLIVAGSVVVVYQQMSGGRLLEMSSWTKTLFAAGIAFYIPDLLLWHISRLRKSAVFLGLPDALDLMVVCVEAGLGLDQAMRKVSEEMKRTYPVIAEEFALANMQLQMGRSRKEVLEDLGKRCGVGDLRSLASILIQSDKFGSSIAQALRVQSDSMRIRRQQIAEEKAAKTAVKLIFPLVLFIFPGIFVVLVGPAAITMMQQMFPAMSGTG